jgi:hypothetical protein
VICRGLVYLAVVWWCIGVRWFAHIVEHYMLSGLTGHPVHIGVVRGVQLLNLGMVLFLLLL